MRSATLMYVCFIFCVIFLSVITQAQTSLTHDTGPLQFTVIDNGYIGDDGTGTYEGVVFNGNVNAMFTAGFIGGNLGFGGTYGMIGSFTSGGTPVIQDYFNVVPFSGFSSDPYFNQISSAETGFTPNPGESSIVLNKSETGQNCVFSRKVFINNTAFDISNIFFGIFADWNVGGTNYLLNRGGYDPARNMLYQYENGGAIDPNYYGILPVNVPQNIVRGTVDKDIVFTTLTQLRLDIFYLMTSTDFAPITEDGDYRTYLSTGPYVIPSGDSLIIDYAFVAGTNLAELQANADSAIAYAKNLDPMPTIPILISPIASVNSTEVEFVWTMCKPYVTRYWFEIDTTDQFTTSFIDSLITDTTYLYSNLESGKDYWWRVKAFNSLGWGEFSEVGTFDIITSVEEDNQHPIEFSLEQNYPNPFNPNTLIKYQIPELSFITIKIYDVLGSEITTLVNEEKPIGSYEVEWNASNVPSGVYFYQLKTNGFLKTMKMVLLH